MTTTVISASSGPLTANGVTPIPFTFQSLSATEIEVTRNGVTAAGNTYTVVRNADGTGSITPTSTWGSDTVYIYSSPNYQQISNFSKFGAFYPDQFNSPLDRAARTIIGLKGYIDRALSSVTAGLGSFLSAGGGAVARTFQDKMRDVVSVKDFGAVGNGVTNDRAAIQAALDSFSGGGGEVIVPSGMRCLVTGGDLIIPTSASLVGPHHFVGNPGDNGTLFWGSVGGTILLDSANTIQMQGGASLSGLLIYRNGMTFPAASAAAYAGTAVTSVGEDSAIKHCLFIGFDKMFLSSARQRAVLDFVYFDCQSGVDITNCRDVARISNCHAWPFGTIPTATNASSWRTGVAFKLTGPCEWAKFTNCFALGYLKSYEITDCGGIIFTSCDADSTNNAGVPDHVGAVGFHIKGTSADTALIGCKGVSQHNSGLIVETSAGNFTEVIGFNSALSGQGILVQSGDVVISAAFLRLSPYGVSVNSAASRVTVVGSRFDTMSISPIVCLVATTNLFIGDDNDYSNNAGSILTGTLPTVPTVASAGALVIPNSGDLFNISGTTTLATLAHGWAGREVTLIFGGALTVTHGTAGVTSMRLAGAVNFVAAANNSLTLRHNGAQWFETARRV